MKPLDHLWSPIKIRSMELPNRAVMPPMGTNLGNKDGTVSPALLAYIRRRAQGGPGLIITEITAVHPSGITLPSQIGAFDDRFLPGLRTLAEVIHQAGCQAAMQLHHAGRESFHLLQKGEAIGPSAIPSVVFRIAPQEMTRDQIHEVVEAFGRAGARARTAGFDAVEIHGAHGYLLTQFLSALSNQRPDEYGGNLKQRARFVIEVIESVRRSVGDDFPIFLRLSAEEFIKNGYTVEDLMTILPDLVAAGADVIHASIGTHGSPAGITSAPPEYEPGFNAWRARKIKEAVTVPVIAVGRFSDPAEADQVIARGDADLVAFGRQSLADPDYLLKAKTGRSGEIRPCIACNQGCIERLMFEAGKVRCAINPETGQELLYPLGPAAETHDVWIIGAGPAGLTAAYEAARLGHQVTLFEQEAKLGGQLLFASRAPHKEIYAKWLSWLVSQIEKMGVTIKTGTRVTAEMLREKRPAAVILAAGGRPIIPSVPGIDLPMVSSALDILSERVPARNNVLVVGGGLVGMETADFLLAKGCRVTLIEALKHSPVLKLASHGYMLHKRLREGSCRFYFGAFLAGIQPEAVTIIVDGREETISPLDQVVLAMGMTPQNELRKALEDMNIRHFVVGDAFEPRRIIEATDEGAKAAWQV